MKPNEPIIIQPHHLLPQFRANGRLIQHQPEHQPFALTELTVTLPIDAGLVRITGVLLDGYLAHPQQAMMKLIPRPNIPRLLIRVRAGR
jgi:hypothetical protein